MLSAWELTCQKARCSYDLSHMSWLRGNRIILFPRPSHSKNKINVVSSGWLKAGSPRKKLKARRPPRALSKQGLFNRCSRGICSKDLIKRAPRARLAQSPSTLPPILRVARCLQQDPRWPGCGWTHQVSSGYLQRYPNGVSDTTGDTANIFGGGTERLLPTAEALGNEFQGLYVKHLKSLIFSI